MNLFIKNIKPEWEDNNNKGGYIFTLEYVVEKKYEINDFMKMVQKAWNKLLLSLIGETLLEGEHINGIRFVDKTKMEKKIMFRFEIWFGPSLPKEKVENTRKAYGDEFGCSGISMKPIPN